MRLRSMVIGATPPLAVVALWFGAIVTPTGRSAGDLQERLAASDAELIELAGVLEESRTVNSRLADLNVQLDQLGIAVPSTPDVAGFIRLAHAVATESGTIISSVTPQTEQPSGAAAGVEVTSVSLSLEGDYPAIMAFIERLLSADRLVAVDSVDLAADSSDGSLFAELAVSVYSEPGGSGLVGDLVDDANQQISDAAAGLTLEAES